MNPHAPYGAQDFKACARPTTTRKGPGPIRSEPSNDRPSAPCSPKANRKTCDQSTPRPNVCQAVSFVGDRNCFAYIVVYAPGQQRAPGERASAGPMDHRGGRQIPRREPTGDLRRDAAPRREAAPAVPRGVSRGAASNGVSRRPTEASRRLILAAGLSRQRLYPWPAGL